MAPRFDTEISENENYFCLRGKSENLIKDNNNNKNLE